MTNLNKEYQKMTPEEFKNIYYSEKLRNEVSFANRHSDKHGVFKYYGTCTYPNENRRQVTPEQIEKAKQLRSKRAAEVLKENKNKLLFVGMGMNYDAKYEDDVCNHRIRTEFLNSEGKRFFIEFGTGRGTDLRIDHAVDRELEDHYKQKAALFSKRWKAEEKKERPSFKKIQSLRGQFYKYMEQPYYNYKKLERDTPNLKYTKTNILKIVNEYFNCNFKEVVVDYYNISCNGVICESPKS